MKLSQGVLSFKIQLEDRAAMVTAHAGLPIIVEALRTVTSRKYWKRLAKKLGYRHWKVVRRHVESLLVLIAGGGRNLDDLRVLRSDEGLSALLQLEPSSPTQAKDFLYRFDQDQEGRRLSAAESAARATVGRAVIHPEGPALSVLGELLQEIVRQLQSTGQQRCATLDVDATILAAHKKAALKAYEGTVGYQPQMAWWAEHGVWVDDQFRDGNVPAEYQIRAFLQHAFAQLPGSVTKRRLRGDSALYNEEALTWLDDQNIQFAVSADMSESLRAHAQELPESAWNPYPSSRPGGEERQCAEVVDFVPEWARNRRKDGEPFRYIAIRVRSRQQSLGLDGGENAGSWRHFAVVTNMDWPPARLLRWQREKQGTIEHAHGVLKNGYAGGTLPTGRFGANAAWWRLNAITHNLMRLVQVRALPRALRTARPKALRFRLLNLPGRITRSAGSLLLHVSSHHPYASALVKARAVLLGYYRPPAPQAAAV